MGDDDRLGVKSQNDGFSSLELLGLLDLKRDDILRQIKGEVKPDTFKRELIKD